MSEDKIVPPAKAGEESVAPIVSEREKFVALIKMIKLSQKPSRDVDASIYELISPNDRVYRTKDDEGNVVGCHAATPDHIHTYIPAYTRNVDDAMSLVPDRFRDWNIRRRNGTAHRVELCEPSHEVEGCGRSLAHAFITASLSAIAEKLPSSQSEGTQ